MICCWIAADCGFLFTCPTAWVTVAKLTPKLFADYSTYCWVFQSAGILHREDAGLVCDGVRNHIRHSKEWLTVLGTEVTILPLFSSSCKATFISELADKASLLYLKLWFRENAGLISNAWWNGISLRIHEYLHFAEFYFFGVFCCFCSVPCNCSAWFLVPFSVPRGSLLWQPELEQSPADLAGGRQGPEPGRQPVPSTKECT